MSGREQPARWVSDLSRWQLLGDLSWRFVAVVAAALAGLITGQVITGSRMWAAWGCEGGVLVASPCIRRHGFAVRRIGGLVAYAPALFVLGVIALGLWWHLLDLRSSRQR